MAAPTDRSASFRSPALPSDEVCRAMVLGMSHGALLFDGAGRVIGCNPAAERILALPAEHLVGRDLNDPWWRALGEDGAPLPLPDHPVLVTLRTGVPLHQVVVGRRRPDGACTWIALDTVPTGDAWPGAGGGVVCTFSDVTQRHAERLDLERQALVARRTNDAVIITDREGRIAWVNAAMLALSGHTLEGLIGRKPGAVLQGPETDPEVVREMGEALRRGQGFHGELLNYRADGSAYWIELSISPAHDRHGGISHFVSIARDISARRDEARQLFHLSSAVQASVDGVALVDAFQDFRFVNDAYARMMGHERGEALVGTSWRRMYARDVVQRFDAEIVPQLYLHDRWQGELAARRADGETVPQELSVTLLSGGGMVMVIRDVTERKAAEAEQARLTAILEATPDLIAIASVEGDVPYLNAAGRRLLGVSPGARLTFAAMFPAWALEQVETVGVPHAMAHGSWNGETAVRGADGCEIPVSQVIVAHRNDAGTVERLSTIMRDIRERKEAEEALRRMSLSDALTGLYNRRGFSLLAQQHLNVARTQPGHAILVYMDLDDFKAVNDTLGHAAGDAALHEVAAILRETFRDSDLCGRLGGDEFVALAVNCLDPTGAVLLRRLDERLAEHNARAGRPCRLSVARGVAVFDPGHPKNLQQLLEEADARLYEDKRARKVAR